MLGLNVDYKKVKVAKLRKDFGYGSFISENGQSNIEKKRMFYILEVQTDYS